MEQTNTPHITQTHKNNIKHLNQITNLDYEVINTYNNNNKKQRYTNYKKRKILLIIHAFLHLLLILSGDIETNPGPMPNVLQFYPPSHKNRCKRYFIECTIKLQPEYQHLPKQFFPIINITYPNHQDTTTVYPHLSRYIYQNQHHPPPRILYALITTISPVIKTCNHILIQTLGPDWTTKVLEQMASLQNPPERHINTPHPYTQFLQTNQDIINPPNNINKKLYNFINQNTKPLTL